MAGLAPGLLSAGLGTVPAEQTYLDVTQGNRVFDSLYDGNFPREPAGMYPLVESCGERAESAPADIVPGLLARTLARAGGGPLLPS